MAVEGFSEMLVTGRDERPIFLEHILVETTVIQDNAVIDAAIEKMKIHETAYDVKNIGKRVWLNEITIKL